MLIQAIEHYSGCPHQCMLVPVGQLYSANLHTTRVSNLAYDQSDGAVNCVATGGAVDTMCPLVGATTAAGQNRFVDFRSEKPYPAECKLGERQPCCLNLCAQVPYLEQMTRQPVSTDVIFYHSTRRRHEVRYRSLHREGLVTGFDDPTLCCRAGVEDAVNEMSCYDAPSTRWWGMKAGPNSLRNNS